MFALLSTLALTQPGIPKPCTYPSAFTASTTMMDYKKNMMIRGTVVYDVRGKRSFQ